MLSLLDQLDKELMLQLNYDGGWFLDQLWYIYSDKWTWIPLYLLLIALMVLKCRKDQTHRFGSHLALLIVLTALLIVLSDQISSGLIKHWVERPRPSHAPGIEEQLHYVNDYHGGRFGFVSSHAANSIAIALWIAYLLWHKASPLAQQLFPRLRWSQQQRFAVMSALLILWALLNCYSRIYLGVHYPGDILGGLLVGIFSFWVIRWLYRQLLRRFPTFTPRSENPTPNAC